MSAHDPDDVGREIGSRSRIRDDLPELVPTSLARELVNHYPADVKRNADHLGSLAADLLGRERRSAEQERAARLREAGQLHNRIRSLESELDTAQRRHAELEADAAATTELRARLNLLVARIRRLGRIPYPSKKTLVSQLLALARAPSPRRPAR